MSFLALQDLMRAIGYSSATAWIFPVIIDTTLAVCTLMLVALGDKPARRAPRVGTQTSMVQRSMKTAVQSAKPKAGPLGQVTKARAAQANGGHLSAPVQPGPVQTLQESAHIDATQVDSDLASELIALGVTTQPVETVMAVLAVNREGASINAAAKASGINYRTAQRIVEAAEERRQTDLVAAS